MKVDRYLEGATGEPLGGGRAEHGVRCAGVHFPRPLVVQHLSEIAKAGISDHTKMLSHFKLTA